MALDKAAVKCDKIQECNRFSREMESEARMVNRIILSDDMLIGMGGHKKVYRHPDDPALCIKILIAGEQDPDW